MNQAVDATLYYVHDPMCSWCWGFRPVWLQLQRRLPTNLKRITWVGGLAADNDLPMPEAMRQNLQDTWRRIQQVIPGTEFNFDFWTENTPRRSTYPACRAVIASRELADKEDEMTYGIQQAYYLQARNPSDLDTLISIAQSIGIDPEQFEQLMNSERIQYLLELELSQVKSIGVNSFPSIVMQKDNRQQDINIDYNSANSLLDAIHHFIEQ